MERPFDFEVLQQRLKDKGLPEIENLAELVLNEVYVWSKESAALHENMLVRSIGLPAIETLLGPQGLIKQQVDMIDGDPA